MAAFFARSLGPESDRGGSRGQESNWAWEMLETRSKTRWWSAHVVVQMDGTAVLAALSLGLDVDAARKVGVGVCGRGYVGEKVNDRQR